MLEIILWTIVFSITTGLSITLMGDRELISGNLLELKKIISIIFHWKFIVAIVLAVGARISFMLLNSAVLKIEKYSQNATTIAAFASAFSFIFIFVSNALFLGERISVLQGIGGGVIILGIFLMLK